MGLAKHLVDPNRQQGMTTMQNSKKMLLSVIFHLRALKQWIYGDIDNGSQIVSHVQANYS